MNKSKETDCDKRLEQLLEQKKNESEALKKLLKAFDSSQIQKASAKNKR